MDAGTPVETFADSSRDAVRVNAAPRLWPAILLVAAFWMVHFIVPRLNLVIFVGFFSHFIGCLLLTLLFSIWWLASRRIPLKERLLAFGVMAVGAVLTAVFSDKSVGPFSVILMGLPLVCTVWVLWLLAARKLSSSVRRGGLLALTCVVWAYFLVIRVEGIDGDQRVAVSGRWSRSSENLYLSELAQRNGQATPTSAAPSAHKTETLMLSPGDWPGFRGESRLGEVRNVNLATDWTTSPPKFAWRQRIGPAWSSVAVVGDRLFTQEQRGDSEAVVCLDPKSGRERWVHEDPVRFYDAQAGPGPRATPTFADGRLYSLGATGVLNCLDPIDGAVVWTRNIKADSGAPLPIWGFSSSPLIVDGLVIVYAGGPDKKGLLAYKIKEGQPAWNLPTGPVSYSSVQLATLGGEKQLLFLDDHGLTAIHPGSGKVLWQYPAATMTWRVAQPFPISPTDVLFGSEDLGIVRLEVTHRDQAWTPRVVWKVNTLRPAYNDFLFLDGFLYGFDEGIFCCVDAQDGRRRWKGGRYGHGQAILVSDQRLVLVISETGELILLAAQPEKHQELARVSAITGKTWNHPVIAHGRLFVRNSEEIACYELPPGTANPAKDARLSAALR